MRSTTIQLVFCILVGNVLGDRQCYWPDGSVASGYFQCNPSDNVHSACCGTGDVCLENGTCFWQRRASFYRNACTDSSFADSSCPQMCLGSSSVDNSRSGASQLVHCNGLDRWCCSVVEAGDTSLNSTCCDDTSSYIDYQAYVRVPVTNTLLGDIHDNVMTQVNTTTTTTAAAAATSCLSNNSSTLLTSTTSASCGHDRAVGIGIGAGSVAGAVLLISIIAVLCMRAPLGKRRQEVSDFKYFGKTSISPQPYPPTPPIHYPSTHPLMELSATNNAGVYEVG